MHHKFFSEFEELYNPMLTFCSSKDEEGPAFKIFLEVFLNGLQQNSNRCRLTLICGFYWLFQQINREHVGTFSGKRLLIYFLFFKR